MGDRCELVDGGSAQSQASFQNCFIRAFYHARMRTGDDALWNGESGAGGISWVERSRMGPLRGVIDAADASGRRNAYMHTLHAIVLERELRRVAPLKAALDFGCGTGRFLRMLATYAAHVYAVDREPAMVDAACTYARDFITQIACWQTQEVPFQAAFFDFILCSSVLCVTTPQLFERSLSEMARMARPGATVIMLEQIRRTQRLTLRTYYDSLRRAGFEPTRAFPIRRGDSWCTALVTRQRWIPPGAYPVLATLELAKTARRRSTAEPYVEWAIVARRTN
jgi:SAM-dependent methyltransferase